MSVIVGVLVRVIVALGVAVDDGVGDGEDSTVAVAVFIVIATPETRVTDL